MSPASVAPHDRHKPEGPMRQAGQRAVRPKASATLLLIRRDGPKSRILMGRRHSGHDFLPDRWVFPGGRVDRADHRAPAASELRPEVRTVIDAHVKPGLARALALAAVRETWEEAGLLLARPGPPRPAAGPWRPFLAQGALPDLAALQLVGRAITPPMLAKRFDTWFLLADAERLISLERQADCGELDEIAWVDFDEVERLALPIITRALLAEALAQMDDPARPKPLLLYRQGALHATPL